MAAQQGILVVEDDVDIREALLAVLSEEGYRPVGAANGRQALDLLGEEGRLPALILLDLMMPVMDGWQFRAAQTEDPRLRDIPVVVISADTDAHHKVKDLGPAGFLKKPIELDTLLGMIERHAR